MHIEPGLLASSTILAANAAAVALLATQAPALLRRPVLWLRTALATVFFSLFMQAFHLPVGPSELHFVGAMPIYLLLGLVPTLFGFALGLLAQGLLFEPQDLVHLGVNALSLMVPLLVVHHGVGRRWVALAAQRRVAALLKLDAVYYAGVTLMVGFWLTQAELATPLSSWASFAASYLAVVALEPLLTVGLVAGLGRALPLAAHTVSPAPLPAWARCCLDERLTAAVAPAAAPAPTA